MNEIQVVADYGDLCGESPLWHEREQALYWGDITGKRLYRLNYREHKHQIVHQGFEIGGIALHESGSLVIVNSGGVWIWDLKDDPRLLIDTVQKKKCAMNDCIVDPEGRIFSGSCFFDPKDKNFERGCLFRIDTDGSGHVVDEGFSLSNGLGFSPDHSTLYFTDSAERVIYAYDYRQLDGSLRNRRPFVSVPSTQGLPDGLTVDAEGFVWSAQWFGGCIIRYDPDGKEQQRIIVPVTQSSSVAFGGSDLTDIFITSAAIDDGLSLAPPGYSAAGRKSGGPLFCVNLGRQGRRRKRFAALGSKPSCSVPANFGDGAPIPESIPHPHHVSPFAMCFFR
jgi:sugar lactone lactonase YvrE